MLEDQFHFQLLKCFNHQKRWINQRTIQIDVLPGQSKILQCLDEYGSLTPKEIGKLCIVDKSTTTSLLNKMEKMHYIEKKNQNHDKRSIQIHLTTLGKEKTQLVKQICQESNQVLLQSLSKKEQKEIIDILKKINGSLEKEDVHGNTK
nr:MarR family transcriptional regulator [uncultured Faecalibacillus sp.]